MLTRRTAINRYLGALKDYWDNKSAIDVYYARAEAIDSFCDIVEKYYEVIYKKLSDVFEELPSIFRQNLAYIELRQREAEEKDQLDDSMLVWPLEYEKKNNQAFQDLLMEAIIGFLNDLKANISRWVGADLDDISRQAYANTDIPGCISDFISEKFGGLLQIDMEKILNDKLTGHTTLDNDVHRRLLDMMDKSVPMFNTRPAYAHTSASKFSIVSVPQNTLRILSAAQKYLGSPNNIVKTSKETTRLYVVKCVAGIPLYAFGRMEEMEAAYERLMSTPETRKGTHLWQDWFERFPSPLGEGAWTAEIYKNARVKKYNDRVRAAFDTCLASGVIVPKDGGATLFLADGAADFSKLLLSGSVQNRLQQLDNYRANLWSSGQEETLSGIGIYRNFDGSDPMANIREAVLRLPRLSYAILKQAELLSVYAEKRNEVGDPLVYVYAILSGLIHKHGFEMVYKQSPDAISYSTLLDLTLEHEYEEYETYQAFHALMNDEHRSEVEFFRAEMMKQIGMGDVEKREKARSLMEQTCKAHSAGLSAVSDAYRLADAERRKVIAKMQSFYDTVVAVCDNLLNKFLN